MTRDELNNAYFDWMYQLVCDDEYSRGLSYRKLLFCFMIRILRIRLLLMATAMTMGSIFDIDSETSKDTGIV